MCYSLLAELLICYSCWISVLPLISCFWKTCGTINIRELPVVCYGRLSGGNLGMWHEIYYSSIFCFGNKYEVFGKQRLFSGGKGDIDKKISKYWYQICSFSLCNFRCGMQMAQEIWSILQSESDVIASCLSIEDTVWLSNSWWFQWDFSIYQCCEFVISVSVH